MGVSAMLPCSGTRWEEGTRHYYLPGPRDPGKLLEGAARTLDPSQPAARKPASG